MTYKRQHLGRLQETVQKASSHAITAPPPRDGEVRRTALPDTFDGIRFEIGRMVEYVRDAVNDPVVSRHAQAICEAHAALSGPENLDTMDGRLAAIDSWCRACFVYVNDPPNVEVIQTPRRMVKQTQVPPEVIRSIISPFYDAMGSVMSPAAVEAYEPPGITSGDCDEGGLLLLSNCACVGIRPPDGSLRFKFGGHDGTLHHVWGLVGCGDRWFDSDLTEPDYKLGDFSRFEHYEEIEVPL